ncbi:MAG: HlyD family type I secretion periplasmic adaptor subunit [Salaquimonas sp.]
MTDHNPVKLEMAATPNAGNSKVDEGWKNKLPTSVRGPIIAGCLIIGVFVGGFGFWGATVPISGAAVASGIVAASGLNQTVDHLEGGIIEEILVVEGARISKDQPLMRLDPTRVLSERDRVKAQLFGLKAKMLRTRAERDQLAEFEYSQEVQEEAKSIGMQDDLVQQEREFQSRRQRLLSEVNVLAQRSQAIEDEIAGLEIQKSSETTKLVVIRDELDQKEKLLKRGLTPRSQFNALQRAEADSEGRIGGLTATIAQRRTTLLEIEKQLITQDATRVEDASSQLNNIQLQVNDLEQQLRSREDVLSRMIILSPIDGVVVKLNKNTVGGVVRPGETVFEILPTGADFIIEARIPPQDIDVVRLGQTANVRFVALNTRTTPEVAASVIYVSADRLVDPDTRAPYYLARLQLTEDLPPPLTSDQIYPGMPVDAFIGTGERTFFEYLSRPITDSFNRAFREQ